MEDRGTGRSPEIRDSSQPEGSEFQTLTKLPEQDTSDIHEVGKIKNLGNDPEREFSNQLTA